MRKITSIAIHRSCTGFTWNVSGGGKVNIDDDGTITALSSGTVEISAAAVGSGVLSNTVSLRIKSPIDGYSKITDYEVVGRTEGKWEQQSPPQNAFDGDILTVYDGQAGGRCGIKMSEPQKITAFRFQGGAGYEERMPGCVFRVSNDGVNYTAVYTISSVKPNGEWNYVYLDDLDAGARELLENNSTKWGCRPKAHISALKAAAPFCRALFFILCVFQQLRTVRASAAVLGDLHVLCLRRAVRTCSL